MKKVKRIYNWVPDRPDHRDFDWLEHGEKIRGNSLPARADLRILMSPVEDQGNLGSCTANAFAGNLEFLANRAGKTFDASRLFIYWNERAAEGTVGEDSGAIIRDGIKTLAKFGVCDEPLWPYVIRKFKQKPPAPAYKAALARKIQKYIRCRTLYETRACLAAGFPVVFGFTVYESFESDKVARTGVVPMPSKDEQVLGGHAVLAVGYDDKHKQLLVRNSWGPKWGQHGYFAMPYDYVANPDLADDFWSVRQ